MTTVFMDDMKNPSKALPAPECVFELSEMKYTSCYCEENIYCMVRDHVPPECLEDYYVVFISNIEKCVALSFQKAARIPGDPVYWDYHVILLHKHAVYDLDTSLPFGAAPHFYFTSTLSPPPIPTPACYFRVIKSADYLRLFSSTRAHMRREILDVSVSEERRWKWLVEPPAWEVITNQDGVENTLERYLDFSWSGGEFGVVYDVEGFLAFVEGLSGAREEDAGRPEAIIMQETVREGIVE